MARHVCTCPPPRGARQRPPCALAAPAKPLLQSSDHEVVLQILSLLQVRPYSVGADAFRNQLRKAVASFLLHRWVIFHCVNKTTYYLSTLSDVSVSAVNKAAVDIRAHVFCLH